MPNTYSPANATYRRIARDAARAAIRAWLRGLKPSGMYLFEVNSVECAMEFFGGHWEGVQPYGLEEGGRWRWGRLDAGDPDDDLSGEDVLLEIALGRPLPPQLPQARRRQQDFPVFAGESDLTRVEIRAKAAARARENLDKLVLHRQPRA